MSPAQPPARVSPDRARLRRRIQLMKPRATSSMPVIGWREWVSLPTLGVPHVKAKVDTGARSSAIHVSEMRYYHRAGNLWAQFQVHPLQRDSKTTVDAHAQVIEQRKVRDSGGRVHLRPVVLTDIELMGERWSIELTLASRDVMGFRMLLGRHDVRGRFLVNPGRSFLGGRPGKKKKSGKKSKSGTGSSSREKLKKSKTDRGGLHAGSDRGDRTHP